ncbi:hypothetical protein AA105894_1472 [Asaia spathodeae NBRC 105894]|nr:hypothetical protein AA105894_1472 [Asaia spathodeae NBRC 105894]
MQHETLESANCVSTREICGAQLYIGINTRIRDDIDTTLIFHNKWTNLPDISGKFIALGRHTYLKDV